MPNALKLGQLKDQNLKSDDPTPTSSEFTVALIGNPNTGKSSIFNSLSGSKQKIGNFPGVTTEKKDAFKKIGHKKVRFIDLPGCYSLQPTSKDEKIAVDYLKGNIPTEKKPDLILFLADATNLKRNFYLLSQIIEFSIPIVIVLTMVDRLGFTQEIDSDEKLKKELNLKKIEEALRLDIIPMISHRQDYIDKLKKMIIQKIPAPPKQNFLMQKILKEYRRENPTQEKIPAYILPQLRYQWASKIAEKYTPIENASLQKAWVRRIDKILTHKYFGLFFFIGVMYVMFELIYSWSEPIMAQIEQSFQELSGFVDQRFTDNQILNSMIIDGIIPGVGSVVIFLPQVIFLFMFIAFLEDSGYIARAIFLMDKVFSWSGLNGRSFVPMLSSFACAVPGIISARIIPDHKTRLVTILVSPMMSCSARLPVYILMIGAFIQPVYGSFWAGFSLFAMHMIGPLIALPLSKIISVNYQSQYKPSFFLEMPPYRSPLIKNIIYRGYYTAKKFLIKAGGLILVFSIVIWALSYFPRDPTVEKEIRQAYHKELQLPMEPNNKTEPRSKKIEGEISSRYLEESYLGKIGKFIQPVFEPLGYDWKVTIAILISFPAREVFISAMGILYNVSDETDRDTGIREKLVHAREKDGSSAHNHLFAFSLMIFFALCCQCMSTLAIIQRELNSWGWVFFTFAYMTSLAYISSLVVYQIGFIFFS